MEDLLRAFYYASGDAGQPRHLDPVTLVAGTLLDLSEKYDLIAPFPHRHVKVLHAVDCDGEFGELVIMRGEQRSCLNDVDNMFGNRPGDAYPVEGTRTPPDLIQDDKAVRCGVVHDVCCLDHLHHESALPFREKIRGPDPRKNPVCNAYGCGSCRYEAPHLGHKHNQGDLSHIRGLPGHVRSGNNMEHAVTGVDKSAV